jgi:hypothetical protein
MDVYTLERKFPGWQAKTGVSLEQEFQDSDDEETTPSATIGTRLCIGGVFRHGLGIIPGTEDDTTNYTYAIASHFNRDSQNLAVENFLPRLNISQIITDD